MAKANAGQHCHRPAFGGINQPYSYLISHIQLWNLGSQFFPKWVKQDQGWPHQSLVLITLNRESHARERTNSVGSGGTNSPYRLTKFTLKTLEGCCTESHANETFTHS